MPSGNPVNLVLAGREGNGKSSTGNSILNKNLFCTRAGNSAGSADISEGEAVIDDKEVKVVDGLSIRDNSIDGKNNVLATIGLAERILSKFVTGFTAILICLKYGVRFTSQEKSALDIIRSLFGENIIKNYGVIVLTHGDNFAKDMEDDGTTFEKWCQDQTGEFQKIYKECGHRIVLFNNRTKDNDEKGAQVKSLMSKVAEIQSRFLSYTMASFKQAYNGQRKLLVLSKLPELQIKTSNLMDSVTQDLRRLEESFYSPNNYLNELERLKIDIDSHKAYLKHEDEGTNSIDQLLLQISTIEASINLKKEKHLRKIEYEERIRRPETPPPASEKNLWTRQRIYIVLGVCTIIFTIIIFGTRWLF